MKKPTIYHEGQRVILKANKKERWAEEHGIFVGMSGKTTALVGVESHEMDDDGLREVTLSQIKPYYDHPSDRKRRAMNVVRRFKQGISLYRLDSPDGRLFEVTAYNEETGIAIGRKAKCKSFIAVPLHSLFPNVPQ